MNDDDIKRFCTERDEYLEDRKKESVAAGEAAVPVWARGARYVDLKECVEAAEAALDWEHVTLPEGAWDYFPEGGDAAAYAEAFVGAVVEILATVEEG